jgi:dipeptidyl aminopeptidase/acylaminoacyl peptidase
MSFQTNICGIPCLQVNPSMKPMGTVLLYHGWVSNINDYFFFASLIANWGYKVIVPELPYHGERGKLDYFNTLVLQKYFWNVVIQGVQEADAIVSELTKMDENIGIIGHSTGGFISAGIFSKNSRLQSSIVINGSCAWVKVEELFREKDGRSPMISNERRSLEEHDPASHLKFDGKRGILLLHGKEDTTIPIESQRYFMKIMSQYNIPSDYLQLVEYSNVNHCVTLGMLEKSKEWIDKHLCK